jgi:ParB-like chromosome segregation protein Spo0J
MPGARGRAARLARLNDAIAASPDEPANYLLRGELLNEEGRCELAAADFERALALARAGLPDESWGLVGQVLQDRALAGLARADAER